MEITPQFLPDYLPTLQPNYIPPTEEVHIPTQTLYGSVKVTVNDSSLLAITDELVFDLGAHGTYHISLASLASEIADHFVDGDDYGTRNAFANYMLAGLLGHEDFINGTDFFSTQPDYQVEVQQEYFYLMSTAGVAGKISGASTNSAGLSVTLYEMVDLHGSVTLDGQAVPAGSSLVTTDLIWNVGVATQNPLQGYTMPYVPLGTVMAGQLTANGNTYDSYNSEVTSPIWNQEFVSV